MSPRGGDRPLPSSPRRPPVRVSRRGGRTTLASGRGGGGGDDGGPGARGGGWLVPALLVLFLLLAGSAAWQWWGPHPTGSAAQREEARWAAETPRRAIEPPPRRGAATVRVEILNGSGEPGAAAKLASYLRQGGFNVVLVGSADRYDYLRTLVVARTDDDGPSRSVTRYLGDVDRVKQRARSEADVTVVVGKDRGRSPWGEGKDPNGRG